MVFHAFLDHFELPRIARGSCQRHGRIEHGGVLGLTDEQVGAFGARGVVRADTRIARNDYDLAPILEAITYGGLDGFVADRKHRYRQAVFIEHDPGFVLGHRGIHHRFAEFVAVVGDSIFEIEPVGGGDSSHDFNRAWRPMHGNGTIYAGNAEIEQYLAEPDEVVGMVMGVENGVEIENAGLIERNDAIATGIDEEHAVSRDNRSAGSASLRIRNRHAGAKQNHGKACFRVQAARLRPPLGDGDSRRHDQDDCDECQDGFSLHSRFSCHGASTLN